ncbi:MAG: cellulase family glycosylhydrolase [Mycobacterium sp.]
MPGNSAGIQLSRRSAMGRGLAVGAVAAAGLSGLSWNTSRDEPVRLTARPVPIAGFAAGSAVLNYNATDLSRSLDIISASRATGIRFDIPWFHVQNRQSTFVWTTVDAVVNAAVSRGFFVLASIVTCPPWAAVNTSGLQWTRPRSAADYAAFCETVAKRYLGKIDAYEIWNEPNGALFFGPAPDAAFYTSMVRAAYPRIKAVDPSVTVLAGAMGSTNTTDSTVDAVEFLTQCYQNSLAGSCDAVSHHPYDWGFAATFADGMRFENAPIRQMIKMHALMKRNGDGAKKLWATEYGAPTVGAVTQEQQNNLLFNGLQQWRGVSYAGPMFFYTMRDAATGGSNAENNFGVATSAYAPKTALYGLESLGRAGYPTTDAYSAFMANADPALGAPVGPPYLLSYGWAMECENGTRFVTNHGFISSPTDVATVARRNNVIPLGAFANNMQDMDVQGGFRIFTHPTFGTHAVYGALLTAWTSNMGFPKTDHYTPAGTNNAAVDFEFARITWSPTQGTTVAWYNA